jgi:CRP-like cAMP-binding protein
MVFIMQVEQVLAQVAKHVLLNTGEQEIFLGLLAEKKLAKKELLLTEGGSCRNFSYVVSGTFRAYSIDRFDKESTVMFAIADWWITDMYAYINRQPAMLFIEALEPGIVLNLRRDDMDLLLEQVPKFERFFRIIFQNAYIREQLRVIQNLSLPAEERYQNFISRYPTIVKRITQKQIASYLGVTPEFLSTIRKTKS